MSANQAIPGARAACPPTNPALSSLSPPWRAEGLRYNAFGAHLKRKFGGRIQRVSLDAGFTCPNVDGAVARGGCNFCDNRSFSPSRRTRLARVRDQMSRGIESVDRRYKKVAGYIAYFQPATNTYAPVDQLAELFDAALSSDPRVVGLAVGTRPDCVPDEVLDLLSDIATRHDVSLELGMQSVNDATLRWMNRAHTHADMINAMDRARGRGFETCAHVILGCPDDDDATMLAAADAINELGVDAAKIHNLYVVDGTPLADDVTAGRLTLMSRDDYVLTVADFLERLSPDVIVERISGDAPPKYLIAPSWCLEKSTLKRSIENELDRRGTIQGSRYVPPAIPPASRPVPPDHTPASIRSRIATRGRLPVLKMSDA